MQKSLYVIVAALPLVLWSSPLFAAPEANLYLNSAGSNTILAGVYTSPYTAQITPGSSYNVNSPTINVICDDFANDSYVPEDWNTNVTTLSSLTSETSPNQNVYYGTSGNVSVSSPTMATTTLTQAQAYEVAALLAIDIDFGSATGSAAQQDYSYALWQLFDPTGSNSPYGGSGAIGWLQNYNGFDSNSAAQAAAIPFVESYLSQAVLAVTQNSGSAASTILSNYNVTIYSYNSSLGAPTPDSSCGGTCPTPQEFISVTQVPEAPFLEVSAVYFLLGGGSLLLFGRRRSFRANS
jgi:hypothetical protein